MPVAGFGSKSDFERMFNPAELDRWGDRWLHRIRSSQAVRLDLSTDLATVVLERSERLTVLDIGCGQSDFLLRLRERFPHHEYHGTDISQNAIDHNRRCYPQIHYQQQALPDIGYPAATFDFISALEVVYYLDDASREQALSAISRALKPNGHLLLSGVLNAKAGYFDEQALLGQIRRILHVEETNYNYAWLITRLEQPLIRSLNKLLTLERVCRSSDADWAEWCKGRSGSKIKIAALMRMAGIRQMALLLMRPAAWLVRGILSSRPLARFCARLSKWYKGSAGRTHILVLARKEDSC